MCINSLFLVKSVLFYFHSAIQTVTYQLEFSLLDVSNGCIYPSTPGPVDVCHLAFSVQAPC